MRLIAHRGFAADHPENTLLAVREASRSADAIEIDVRRCATGEPVVIHDADVDRVTDAAGPVSSFSLDELSALSVLGSDQGVPSLEAVLATVPSTVPINVELKEPGLAGDVVDLVESAGNEVFVSAFDPDWLREMRADAPDVPLAYLFHDGTEGAVETATDLGCRYLHPSVEDCSPALVEAAHRRNLDVNVWTVTEPETASLLAGMGVDGVIADSAAVV